LRRFCGFVKEIRKLSGSSQTELDFGDAARLEAHLARCGFAPSQAALAALVLSEGQRRVMDDGSTEVWILRISSRSAARKLRVSDRAVRNASATLVTQGWFRRLQDAVGRPPLYVLDAVAARSIDPLADRLDGFAAAPPGADRCGPTADYCGPSADQVRTADHCGPHPVVSYNGFKKSVVLPVVEEPQRFEPQRGGVRSSQGSAVGPQRSAVEATAEQTAEQTAQQTAQQTAERLDERLVRAWDQAGGVTGDDLRRLVRTGDLVRLGAMYDQARRLGWIAGPAYDAGGDDAADHGADGPWFRFLVCAHHAATARLARPVGALRSRIGRGLDVARVRQASDQWAGAMLARRHRDPVLAARMMTQGEE
jgi:hypothetical protein